MMFKAILFTALTLTTAWATAQTPPTDLRVLIDVSGSMKSNDPNALRRPAAELIARLLPPQSDAGVWLFGTQTRALVQYGLVNQAWRANTLSSSSEISSSDQFTDIEQALSKGLAPQPSQERQCHLILVTDGLIDLPQGAAEIRESRARIESQLIPQAIDQSCKIHTLSLSDQTDRALLNRLSQSTGGLSAQLEGAAQLLPVVLDALELALPDNRLPIQGQSFQVDSSVSKQTVISLTPTDQTLKLVTPDGQVIDPDNLPQGVEYQSSQGFQLYQITDPQPGLWKSIGDAQIDRVLAEADIGLDIVELPSTIELGQPVNLVVRVLSNDQPVTLDTLELTGRLAGRDLRFETSEQGQIAALEFDAPGTYRLDIKARSGLFERTLNRTIEVIPPQAATALETGTTQGIQSFEAPTTLAKIDPITQPAAPPAQSVSTNEGLTLIQWLWIILGSGLAIVIATAFWLARAEKKT